MCTKKYRLLFLTFIIIKLSGGENMHILVCVKQVPENQSGGLNEDTYTVKRTGTSWIMNPADEHALEAALTLKDSVGCKVSVLTMGNESAASMLRYTASLGADSLFHISDPIFAGSDSMVTATILGRAISLLPGINLILCGRKSLDGATAQIPPQLSVVLDLPCITHVTEIRLLSEKTLFVTRKASESEQSIEVDLAAVVSICEGINHLRLPSILGIRWSASVPLTVFTGKNLGFLAEEVGFAGSSTRVQKILKLNSRRKCLSKTDIKSGIQLIVNSLLQVEEEASENA